MSTFSHTVATTGRRTVAAGKTFVGSVRRVLSDVRRNRTLIEKEIHGGKYKLYSKNDDDLRMVP